MTEDYSLRPEQKAQREQNLQQPMQRAAQQMQANYGAGVVCPKCGTMNEAGAQFCASCGCPIGTGVCPSCGSPVDLDADFCEVCHHYIRQDICSFCGAHIEENAGYCPECGSPRGGIVCPVCHTLNEFSFCKQCGKPLTEEAKAMQARMKQMPEFVELRHLAEEYNELQMQLPYASEQDRLRDMASQQLRERILTLLAEDEGVQNPTIKMAEQKRCSKEELNAKKQRKMEELAQLLDRLAMPAMPSPAKARNYAMAQKPAGVRLAWVCNYKNAMHSSPCGCAKPQMGGRWIVLGHNSNQEIKDDK